MLYSVIVFALSVAAVALVYIFRLHRHGLKILRANKELSQALERERDLLGAESVRADSLRVRLDELEQKLATAEKELERRDAAHALELARAVAPQLPARLRLEQSLSSELIEQFLAGTDQIAPVRAVLAHVAAKLVAATDEATGRPQVMLRYPDRTVAPYTAEDRLYDSGRAGGLAELLSELQAMTAAKEQDTAA